MAKIRKAVTAAITGGEHLSAGLVSAALVAALVAGLAVFAVPNAPAAARRAP